MNATTRTPCPCPCSDRDTQTAALVRLLSDPAQKAYAESELLRLHGGLLRANLRRFSVPAGVDPDDLLQEGRHAFVRAMRLYRPDKGSFSAYVSTAIYLAYKGYADRHCRTQQRRCSIQPPPPEATPQHDPASLPAWALPACSPLEADLLTQHVLLRRPIAQAAASCGIDAARAREAIQSCLWRLRQHAPGDEGGGVEGPEADADILSLEWAV
jgi:DNA-directed RNA polymerase specialized sigma24 family protein